MRTLCPNKSVCGSCTLSDLPYQDQLNYKLNEINNFIKNKDLGITKIKKIIPSPQTDHYRNRMDYAISYRGEVGLKQKGKWWKIIDGHTCFIADSQIEKMFFTFRDWVKASDLSFYDRRSHLGLLRYVSIRSTTLGETMVTVVTNPPMDKKEENKFLQKINELKNKSKVTSLIWGINSSLADTSTSEKIIPITKRDHIIENINSHTYKITPNSFFQTNPYAAKILQDHVNTYVKEQKNNTLLDLYCGSGFFTIGAGQYAKNLIGVETIQEAVDDANWNKKQNNITNINFLHNKSEEINLNKTKADIIIVDPPRTGLTKNLIDNLMKTDIRQIIYISCNYQKFADDAYLLSQKYKMKEIRAIDMFPHTPHVEIVSLFTN
ncbi:23S rRNA (uracil-5-)-methyltransferase RumA [candidate division WWE3 bacterium RBG_19FT_COMBO_34_6]|uniref:23S rRNA (Uracil-5-)-methyltransferase RumA n=1 Tax=candidate division WWE3 bacterium RBG_19FT_COMBO_34_6 TaxID=1802612 RepID=A0A1F4ULT5_UNCKA|nr:MAG: 23S rRNA (uracil-5-)-methyltransferase RumA [candidate division WWE3 bacterium RBG_19FT_COMBO_34_6]